MGKLWQSLMTTLVFGKWFLLCLGCTEEERVGLLQLKANIDYPNGNYLPFWIDDKSSNCCEWFGVVCDSTTRRVVTLNLDSTKNYGDAGTGLFDIFAITGNCGDADATPWHFNASLFLPFKMLRALFLGNNNLVGWVKNEGFENLAELSQLQILDLSCNSFSRSILPPLSQLSSLKSLNLSNNPLDGSSFHKNSYEKLSSLKNLEILYLSNTRIKEGDFQSACSINDFTNLKELDISYNMFESLGPMHGLQNLENLHLRFNYFNNSVFSSLKELPSLKILDLSANFIKGPVQMNEINALRNLEVLDLSLNEMESFTTRGVGNGNVSRLQALYLMGMTTSNTSKLLQSLIAFSSIKTLSFQFNFRAETISPLDFRNMSKLEKLVLDDSRNLDKNFLIYIGKMKSLKVLSLSGCGLNGTLPAQGWCELENLQQLNLGRNDFQGTLPSCLGNLTSLRFIDLSQNGFTGNIAFTPLSKMTSIESLSISSNHFQVPLSFRSFGNHSNLKVIDAGINEVVLDSYFENSVPSFQLKFFSVSNCTVRVGHLAIPSFLLYQSSLRIIDLSLNKIEGDFPVWLLENNTKLEILYMNGNALQGTFMLPTKTNHHIKIIDVSDNKLSEQIPAKISLAFPCIIILDMSHNNLVGNLSSTFGDLKFLEFLDISNNNLTGGWPEELATGCISLSFLKLSNNKFYGQIFTGSFNLYRVKELYLDNNDFDGLIPLEIIPPLIALDVSNNHLYGKFPAWIGNMTNIARLALSENQLEGPIPIELCKLEVLIMLDLSENNLSGSIPTCFDRTSLTHVHLSKNKFVGQQIQAFHNCTQLVTLVLRDNNFKGSIPKWIGSSLKMLSVLDLSHNNFEGQLPRQLCLLTTLSILDLSYNNFVGQIPPCLGTTFTHFFETSNGAIALLPLGAWEAMESYLNSRNFFWAYPQEILLFPQIDLHFLLDCSVCEDLRKVEFTTKRNSYLYEGSMLDFMLGIDLSCNQLSGNIPPELGNLSLIPSLNLSHNNLSGAIPTTFSGLRNVQGLDLSYNMLNGTIPAQLVELSFLEVFSVAHNNLSGSTPEQKGQFSTFDKSSYEGNTFLCGPPLVNLCRTRNGPPQLLPVPHSDNEGSGFMDIKSFYISFLISYTIILLAIVAVLCINPYWRKSWFMLIEFYMMKCYYSVIDTFHNCS